MVCMEVRCGNDATICVQEEMKKFQVRLAEEREKRFLERAEQRKAERKAKWLKQKQEKEQLKKDEQSKRGWQHCSCPRIVLRARPGGDCVGVLPCRCRFALLMPAFQLDR